MWRKWLLVSGVPDSTQALSERLWSYSFPENFCKQIFPKAKNLERGKWGNRAPMKSGFHQGSCETALLSVSRVLVKGAGGTDGQAGVKMPPHRVHSSSPSNITPACFHFTSDHSFVYFFSALDRCMKTISAPLTSQVSSEWFCLWWTESSTTLCDK